VIALPLSDEELEELDAFLAGRGGRAMDAEKLDGFFCALVMGPELVMPSEYLPVVWGEDDGAGFESLDQAREILQLVMRHWNTIASAVEREELYLPVILDVDAGTLQGRRWARGFMRGVGMRRSSWAALVQDESEAGSLFAIALLAGEVDAEFPKQPLPPEKQESLLTDAVAGMNRIARYFLARRQAGARVAEAERSVRRKSPKVGRNEPCPCGSGRKFKQCCGREGAQT
jgi:uncharacterized protein